MSSSVGTKLGVGIMALMMVLFLGVGIGSAIGFISTGQLPAILIGFGVLGICAVGVWYLVTELRFGLGMQSMARTLEKQGALMEDNVPKRPSGRYYQEEADAEFERVAATADPNKWEDLYQVAIAYDAAGDRPRGRKTMRQALKLYRQQK